MNWNPALERPWTRAIADTSQGSIYTIKSSQRQYILTLLLPVDLADQALVIRLTDNWIKAINDKAPGA